ncbi:MAG: SRPBCC domain-containing protein, partial [Bdellovibrionota bacterium]
MYEVWTNPKHFEKWLPPTGFNMTFLKADIRPGGKTLYLMSNDSGVKMYGRAEYLEMQKPNLLVYTQQFCDENENVSRHPMAPTWPETMLTKVTLAEEGPTQTRVTIEWEVHGKATAEEMATFINGKPGMTMGWT